MSLAVTDDLLARRGWAGSAHRALAPDLGPTAEAVPGGVGFALGADRRRADAACPAAPLPDPLPPIKNGRRCPNATRAPKSADNFWPWAGSATTRPSSAGAASTRGAGRGSGGYRAAGRRWGKEKLRRLGRGGAGRCLDP